MTIRESVLNVMAFLPACIVAVILPLGLYWLLEPPPVRLIYASPYLLNQPVDSIEDAAKQAVTETVGGRDLYRLVIYCVDRSYNGTIRRAWVNDAVIWHAPDRSTMLSRKVGCNTVNSRIPVPTSSPTRIFELMQTVEVDVNPIRTEHIEFPPAAITILDGSRK